jgi:uncharacterized damage-inducible protein DinB
MTVSMLDDGFGHHVWATLRVLDACAGLNEEQLTAPVEGTYGSILDTLRHVVAADAGYLNALTGGRVPRIEEEAMSLGELRATMDRHGPEWIATLRDVTDPGADVVRVRDDGTESHAPAGIRLAQALHHGTDHRSQVCTALTVLGHRPPDIDVWDWGEVDGRVFEAP